MTEPLERGLRSRLEAAVKQARRQAEAGAHAALHELGVADATGVSYIDIAQPMAGHYEWMFDGIYPNAQGYEAIAQVLAPELATVVSG